MNTPRRVVAHHSERVRSLLVLLCSLRTWGDRVEITTALRGSNRQPGRSAGPRAPGRRADTKFGHGPHRVWPVWAAAVLTTLVAAVVAGLAPAASAAAVAAVAPAALVDVRCRRIPDRWLVLAGTALLTGLAIGAILGSDPDVAGAAAGMVTFGGPLLVLHVVSPASMGFGDVKAATVLGAALGVVHWHLAMSALAIAAGLSVTVAVITRARTIPFGPGLVTGAAIALVASAVFLPPTQPPVGGGRANVVVTFTGQATP